MLLVLYRDEFPHLLIKQRIPQHWHAVAAANRYLMAWVLQDFTLLTYSDGIVPRVHVVMLACTMQTSTSMPVPPHNGSLNTHRWNARLASLPLTLS